MPRVPCRFYASGRCNRGDSCQFYHDPSQVEACRFFQQGYCRAGDECRFRHEREAASNSSEINVIEEVHDPDSAALAYYEGYVAYDEAEAYQGNEIYGGSEADEEIEVFGQDDAYQENEAYEGNTLYGEDAVWSPEEMWPMLTTAEVHEAIHLLASRGFGIAAPNFESAYSEEESAHASDQNKEDNEDDEDDEDASDDEDEDEEEEDDEDEEEEYQDEWEACKQQFYLESAAESDLMHLPNSVDLPETLDSISSSDDASFTEIRHFVEEAFLEYVAEHFASSSESEAECDFVSSIHLEEVEISENEDDDPNRESDGSFRHERWEGLARERGETDLERKPLCQQWRETGKCPFWRSCSNAHGHRCETCGKWCLHPYNRNGAKMHQEVCTARAGREATRQLTSQQECGICMEAISEKPIQQQKFGLLSCNHCFCLGCVRDWRAQKDEELDIDSAVRSCPVCRQRSDFVTPSKVWPATPEEKSEIIEGYKARLATIKCRYWMQSPEENRRCPFGSSCFYHHPGEKKKMLRLLTTADGGIEFQNAIQLSDFFKLTHI